MRSTITEVINEIRYLLVLAVLGRNTNKIIKMTNFHWTMRVRDVNLCLRKYLSVIKCSINYTCLSVPPSGGGDGKGLGGGGL